MTEKQINGIAISRLNTKTGRTSVKQIKESLKRQFKDRINNERRKDVDHRRDIFQKFMNSAREQFLDIKKNLSEGTTELDPEEMLTLYIEIQQENNNAKIEMNYNLENELSTEYFENTSICCVCNKYSVFDNKLGVICNSCATLYFSTDYF